MFVPLSDENHLRYLPYQYMTVSIIAVTTLVQLALSLGLLGGIDPGAVSFGYIPAAFAAQGVVPPRYLGLPDELTLVTYQFLHGGWLHLGGNMLFLWVFGDNVEDAMGPGRFLVFYLLCGVGAAIGHTLAFPYAEGPLIGASGAVAGIIGAYLVLHPRVKVWILVLGRIPLRLRAMYVLGFWLLLQLFMALDGSDTGVAWWAHVGGFAVGAALVPVFRRRGVPLFDRGLIATRPPDGP